MIRARALVPRLRASHQFHRHLPSALSAVSSPHAPSLSEPESLHLPTILNQQQQRKHDVLDPLVDSFNRPHSYLRLSLTEKCNLRCIYCMPDTTPPSLPPPTHLTSSELIRLTILFASHGVNKVRLTGGEPLLRHDIADIMREISNLDNIHTVGITTNGVTLSRSLQELIDVGLNSVNISLDTLIEPRFELLTRRKGHSRVLRAIEQSVEANLPTKVNVVVMRGINDDELVEFVRMTEHRSLDVRFIEYMPFDGNRWAEKKFLSYAAMTQIVAKAFGRLENIVTERGDTTKYYRVPGFRGRIGLSVACGIDL